VLFPAAGNVEKTKGFSAEGRPAYRQEHLPDVAKDLAKVMRLDAST
jgi:hypothetical protein